MQRFFLKLFKLYFDKSQTSLNFYFIGTDFINNFIFFLIKNWPEKQAMVLLAFNLSTFRDREDLCKFKASLVYIVCSGQLELSQ